MKKTMKYLKLFTTAVILAAAFTACSDNESNSGTNNGRTELSINAGIATRAVDNIWEKNDAIGILMLINGTQTPADEKTNYRYTTTAGDGAFAPADKDNTAYYPTDNSPVDIMAYYPYNGAVTTGNFIIDLNTAKQDKLSAIDLMTATKAEGHSTLSPQVKLEFAHRLSKLIVTVKKTVADGTMDDVDLTDMTVVLQGTPTTARYNLLTDELTDKGEATDITLPLTYDGARKQHTSTTIVLPTPAEAGMRIVLTLKNGKQYIVPFKEGDALASGTMNMLNITLHRTNASLTATILPWATGVEGTLGVTINTVALDAALKGGTYTPANNDILCLGGEALETTTVDYTYNEATKKWSTPATPYWDYSKTGPFSFYALITPTAATGDNEKDYLHGTVDGVQFGGDLNFTTMEHLMSKVTLTLASAGGVTADEIKNAVLTWEGISQIDKVNAADGTFTYQKNPATVTLGKESGNDVVRTLLVAPQTLADAARKMNLQIGSRHYAIDLSTLKDADNNAAALGKLEAARHYAITATVTKQTTSVNLTVTDWIDMPSTLPVTIAILTTGSNNDNYKPAVKDSLWLCSDQILVGPNEDGHLARYVYSEKEGKGIWTPNTATTPIYWIYGFDSYTFHSLVLPDNTPAGGSEKDYLYGMCTGIAYGNDLNFTLNHTMSRFTVKLKAGIGYTLSDLSGATLKWTSVKDLDKMELNEKGYTAKMKATTKEVMLNKGTVIEDYLPYSTIIAPQALLADAQKLVLAIGNRSYTLSFAKLTTDDGKSMDLSQLEPGKSYTITATLDKNEANLSLGVADWVTVNGGDGGFDYDN